MNPKLKKLFVLASVCVMSVTSCLNENSDPNDGVDKLPGNVASVQSQVASMQSSVADMKSVQEALMETSGIPDAVSAEFDACVTAVEEHVAAVEAGMTAVDVTLAAMALQKEIAAVVCELEVRAELLAGDDAALLKEKLDALEAGVCSWLGSHFEGYYAALAAEARLNALISAAESQNLSVDALVSDVEAGLRSEDASGILPELLASVEENIKAAEELKSRLVALNAELEEGYTQALKSSSDSSADIRKLNSKAASVLKAASASVSDLMSKVSSCEDQITDLDDRLAKVEADINKLLGMIQSLTFVSEYSEDSAVAYYSMDLGKVDQTRADEGKKVRNAESNFKLSYLVRPASAASALAEKTLWNKDVTIKGYEVPRFQLMAANYEFKNLEIEDVTADASTGLVTLVVTNGFTNDFYFEEVGAKVGLSVVSGKTDITSKFVEVLPKDKSGKVYAESLTLTPTSLTLQKGATAQLKAVVTPADVTDKGVVWNTYGSNLFSVDGGGKLTGNKAGDESPVEVTANATDKWGRTLTAVCNVTVTPAFAIRGADFVEVGGTITLDIESPDFVDPKLLTWSIDSYSASITSTADGKCEIFCKADKYDTEIKDYAPVTVKCVIAGATPVELTKDIRLVVLQPKSLEIAGLAYDEEVMDLKLGSDVNINGTILPESVDKNKFRVTCTTNRSDIAKPDYTGSTHFTGVAYGKAPVVVTIQDETSGYYFWPRNKKIERNITLNVEPYWVESVSLPTTITLNPDDETSITPEFTSDVDGHQPTNTKNGEHMIWTIVEQSTSGVIELTSDGVISAKKIGTAKIRVTTDGEWTAKETKYAECIVVVEKKADNAPVVGHYYYSNGTWGSSSTAPSGTSVVGVVFSTSNATLADSRLANDHSTCTHGLVVCTKEFTSGYGSYLEYGNNGVPKYLTNNSWPLPDAGIANGYTSTLALQGYQTFRGGSSDYMTIVEVLENSTVPALNGDVASTGWYIPSFKEMQMLREAMSSVNSSLNGVGTKVGTGAYWTSTMFDSPADNYDDLFANPINMTTGDWDNPNLVGRTERTLPVRIILAF